ncbi:MAG: hypothetical protein AAE986_08065 [Thermoplasmataceae archaeon]|jgi:hypothetical protein|nr:hypothetical protein [Candidatus Thermoplasmatota archaeon]
MKEEKKLKVFNVGTSWFVKPLEDQGIEHYNLDWSPPAKIDKDISSILKKLGRK